MDVDDLDDSCFPGKAKRRTLQPWLYILGEEVHTSCSKPIYLTQTYGPFADPHESVTLKLIGYRVPGQDENSLALVLPCPPVVKG